jgi:hypothetical protein
LPMGVKPTVSIEPDYVTDNLEDTMAVLNASTEELDRRLSPRAIRALAQARSDGYLQGPEDEAKVFEAYDHIQLDNPHMTSGDAMVEAIRIAKETPDAPEPEPVEEEELEGTDQEDALRALTAATIVALARPDLTHYTPRLPEIDHALRTLYDQWARVYGEDYLAKAYNKLHDLALAGIMGVDTN